MRWPCECLRRETVGEPYTGNLSVRFDEGHGFNPRAYSTQNFECLLRIFYQASRSLTEPAHRAY